MRLNTYYNKYIITISHCIFVDGIKRSVILDIQRNSYEIIPASLSRIIKKYQGKQIQKVYDAFGVDNKKIVDEYFDFLIENEYIFLSDHKNDNKRFLPLNTELQTFNTIDNIVIDLNEYNKPTLTKVITELKLLNCNYVQIRIYDIVQLEEVGFLMNNFDETQVRNIDVILPYHSEMETFHFELFFVKFQRLGNLIFYNSPIDDIKHYLGGLSSVCFVKYNYTNPDYCGATNASFFTPSQLHFTESQQHNTCLNHKVCIDAEGNIKNCPSMQRSFGNIKDTTLQEAIEKPGFKDLWFIHKDQIDVCKDCEFRHMCSDCRCFIKDPENMYSQPAKCTYNPYIAKWQGEKGYVPVEECGSYTKEAGFVPDKEKIAKLNKVIWGED